MVYDTRTVLERYRQLQDLPEGELDESLCPLAQGAPAAEAVSCAPGGCQSCCLGVIEVVKQYSEQKVALEKRPVQIQDTQTLAEQLGRE